MTAKQIEQFRGSKRALWAVLVCVLALQIHSWNTLEGYQLADSVEYMERARNLALGQEVRVDGAVRSFGFSLLLTPVFWIASLFGAESSPALVWIVRLLQMGLGLGLVIASARLAERVTNRPIGWVAAALIGANPIFLQYAVSPVSGIAAGLFIALALNHFIERGDLRSGFRGGLWLGAALLMAYQSLLVSFVLFGLLLLRDRWKHRGQLLGGLAGFSVGVLTQVGIDRLTWGEWGLSLINYLIDNAGAVIVRVLVEVGWIDLAARVYHRIELSQQFQREITDNAAAASEIGITDLQSPLYYLYELPQMLVWPVIGLSILGLSRCVSKPSWKRSLPVLLFAVNALIMSLKGAKSFRLWLPLLPLIAVIAALGWDGLVTITRAQSRRLSEALGVLFLISAGALGVKLLSEANTRSFGSYWDAMERVNLLASAELRSLDPGPKPPEEEPGAEYWGMRTVCSAYHWAVFQRQDANIALLKLPYHFGDWERLAQEEREVLLSSVSHHHWLILHEPLLEIAPELTARIDRDFELETAYWSPDSHPDMGAVLVLKRRYGRPKRVFSAIYGEEVQPLGWREEKNLQDKLEDPIHFLASSSSSEAEREQLTLLGWDIETLPGSELSWLTCHWSTKTGLSRDYTIVTRITTWDGKHAWQKNSSVLRFAHPLSEWLPGQIHSESHLVHLGEKPFQEDFSPMGGPWRRGDLMPAKLWFQVVELERDEEGLPVQRDDAPVVISRLEPCKPGTLDVFQLEDALELQGGRLLTPDGWWFSPDRLIRAGGFFARIRDEDRWPDDGSADPE
ncbi:MAG: hypothetical protein OSB14_01155 [Planctomycetota bacterium]|nr:hypothetical protein [Planctomycetota bacterium]